MMQIPPFTGGGFQPQSPLLAALLAALMHQAPQGAASQFAPRQMPGGIMPANAPSGPAYQALPVPGRPPFDIGADTYGNGAQTGLNLPAPAGQGSYDVGGHQVPVPLPRTAPPRHAVNATGVAQPHLLPHQFPGPSYKPQGFVNKALRPAAQARLASPRPLPQALAVLSRQPYPTSG